MPRKKNATHNPTALDIALDEIREHGIDIDDISMYRSKFWSSRAGHAYEETAYRVGLATAAVHADRDDYWWRTTAYDAGRRTGAMLKPYMTLEG